MWMPVENKKCFGVWPKQNKSHSLIFEKEERYV